LESEDDVVNSWMRAVLILVLQRCKSLDNDVPVSLK
jgi:hypothetical protein